MDEGWTVTFYPESDLELNKMNKDKVIKGEFANVDVIDDLSMQSLVNSNMAQSITDSFAEYSPAQIEFTKGVEYFRQEQLQAWEHIRNCVDGIALHIQLSDKTGKSKVMKSSFGDILRAIEDIGHEEALTMSKVLREKYNITNGMYGFMSDVIEECRYIMDGMEYVEDEDVEKSKSVTLKGYKGHWQPIAKSGHYTMWKSVEMGDDAFNVITKTMKQKSTGQLVEKIAYEDVDGFNDDRAKMFKNKDDEQEYTNPLLDTETYGKAFTWKFEELAKEYGMPYETPEDMDEILYEYLKREKGLSREDAEKYVKDYANNIFKQNE